MTFFDVIETTGKAVDGAGVAAIVVGATYSAISVLFLKADAYRAFRRRLGRSILLGLELLVAADIIRTVAIRPDFSSVGILGGIVLIRTFLSFALELEISGRWPWQQKFEAQ